MFHWIKRKELAPKPKMVEFGRYQHKPVLERAVCFITEISQLDLIYLIANRQLTLNGDVVVLDHLSNRLEAGGYRIERLDTHDVWRFFIK